MRCWEHSLGWYLNACWLLIFCSICYGHACWECCTGGLEAGLHHHWGQGSLTWLLHSKTWLAKPASCISLDWVKRSWATFRRTKTERGQCQWNWSLPNSFMDTLEKVSKSLVVAWIFRTVASLESIPLLWMWGKEKRRKRKGIRSSGDCQGTHTPARPCIRCRLWVEQVVSGRQKWGQALPPGDSSFSCWVRSL